MFRKRTRSHGFISPMGSSKRAKFTPRRRLVFLFKRRKFRRGGGGRIQNTPRHFGGEIKTVDIIGRYQASGVGNAATINSTAQLTLLNGISEGTGFWNRVGRKISMVSIQFKGWFGMIPSHSSTDDFALVMIVYDKQTNGALPSADTIIGSYQNDGTFKNSTLCLSYGYLNQDNKERYEILMRDQQWLPSGASGATDQITAGTVVPSGNIFTIERMINLRGRPVHYQGTTSGIGDVATGGLYLYTQGSIVSGSELYLLNWSMRLRFLDN